MSEKDHVKFLGTAGARFVMARQLRYSAGTFLRLSGKNLLLDPGPGTLTRCATARPRVDVTALDGVILTHAHIDHSGDVNTLVDAMTEGGLEKRGALFAPAQCLEGKDRVVLNYLKDFPERVITLEPETEYELDGLKFGTTPAHRHSVETYGIRFHRRRGDLSFVTDTAYFDGLAHYYCGSDVLVINVVRHTPHSSGKVLHLTLEGAERVIEAVSPRIAVLTHFGMTMLRAKPWELAEQMGERLGSEVRAASDGMTLQLEER